MYTWPFPTVPAPVLGGEHVVSSGTEAAPAEGVPGAAGATGAGAADEAERGPAVCALVCPSAAAAAAGRSYGHWGGSYHTGVGGVTGQVV